MSTQHLNNFFNPRSVAIVGASERESSVGYRLLLNMQEAGFSGSIYPVNNKRDQILGLRAYPSIDAIPEKVDLAVVATPAHTVPAVMIQCGEIGVSSVVVITAGFGELGDEGARLQRDILNIAKVYGIRIIGPNCLGIARPGSSLNATFGDGVIPDGNLALLSQSGAVCTAVLDWAKTQDIGFSTVVSMGASADIDFGEVLHHLADDDKTTGILMYVEGVRDAERFLSGIKAAAITKPVILVKSGRHEAGSKAAMSHTGAMVGGDNVFDAAIEQAGAIRVYRVEDLFSAALVLSKGYSVKSNRLAIITNAGGPGVMCTDYAEDVGVRLAELNPLSMETLNGVLPAHWSRANPIDILGDATSGRYCDALQVCLTDAFVDGVLVVLTPQAMTDPARVAAYIADRASRSDKPVFASWIGGDRVQEGRDLFSGSVVSHFNTPEAAIDAFSLVSKYSGIKEKLKHETTELDVSHYGLGTTWGVIDAVQDSGRDVLTALESKQVLSAFNIPTNKTLAVSSALNAVQAAEEIGYPVVLKINMPEFSHKSDIGGVKLNLGNSTEVYNAYLDMESAVQALQPEIDEVRMTVEAMFKSKSGRELMIGVVRDPVFGPAISFGLGGTMVEILKDNAIALPPLTTGVIGNMIAKTKAAKYLQAFRNMPPANIGALTDVLLNISALVTAMPEIVELDINPLIVDERGAIAVDARIKLG